MTARPTKVMLGALLTLFAVLGLGAAPSANAVTTTGTVYLIHGLVGTVGDIYLDDNRVKANAAPKSVVGPMRLGTGAHKVTFKTKDAVLVSTEFTVETGRSIEVVMYRTSDADRRAVVTVFPNDLTPLAPGTARLAVTNVAAAPPIDMLLGGVPLLTGIATGETLPLMVPQGTATMSIAPSGAQAETLVQGVSVRLARGVLTRAFVIGDSSEGSVDVLLHQIALAGATIVGSADPVVMPNGVRSGDGGQASGFFFGYGASFALWAGALLAGLAVLIGRRRVPQRAGRR